MNELKDRILALQQQSAALEPGEEERDRLLKELQYFSNHFINSLDDQKAYVGEKASIANFEIGKGTHTLTELLKTYGREVAAKGVKPASGGHMGYIPGGGIFTAALGDYLADITNEYAGISFASPGAVAMEHALLNWMKSLFDFPETAVGNLTSGGSIANMIALTAARDKYNVKGAQVEKSVVYLSEHLHHCNLKALRIIGLEDVIIRHLKLDERSRIDPADLEEKISADARSGLKPFLVIASAGTTDTGAVDPLKEIGDICVARDLWFHIDAAYGGFFILAEKCKALFHGIGLANSLAVDPHKGLFLPFGLGAVLIKDREAVFHSHHHSATYMQDAKENAEVIDPADVSPELTKHFRALRLWLPLQLHGTAPFIACLEEKLLLTTYFRNRLLEEGFTLGPEPDLTVSYFWWPRAEGDENSFNKRLIKEIHKDGRVFLTSTTINGKFVIRIAILSFRSKMATVDLAMEMILKAKMNILEE